MRDSIIDLHTHSTASDGTDAPGALAGIAASHGLSAIGLTDHDTVAGLAQFLAGAGAFLAVPGVEVSAHLLGLRLHVVGLGVRPERAASLKALFEKTIRWRNERNSAMVERLCAAGAEVTLAEVEALAGGEVVARPHFARALQNRGHVASAAEAFARFLGERCPGFVPKVKPRLEEIIGAIHDSAALAIAAHPNTIVADDTSNLEARLRAAKDAGMDGVEAFHPDVPPGLSRRVLECARKLGLLISGGSDYHGRNKEGVYPGRGARHRRIRAGDVWDLLERLGDMGFPVRGGMQ